MKKARMPFVWKSVMHALAVLGLLFVALFATSSQFRSGIPGYLTATDPFYMLKANWNSDLRTGFVWYSKAEKFIEPVSFAAQCRMAEREGALVQWQSPIGTFWLPAAEGIPSLIDMAYVIQQDTYTHEGRTVKPGNVVLDCGAHVGSFTRKALDKGASLVVAIEPSAEKVECLKKNFAAEVAAGKVRVLQVGIWSHDDKLWLEGMSGVGNSLLPGPNTPGQGPGEWVRVTTLDRLAEEQGLGRVNFVKMDIEGAESEALRGARGIIARFRPFLAIGTEHTQNWAQNARNVIAAVKQSGVNYKLGFGRYGHRGRKPYAPMEVFFYQ